MCALDVGYGQLHPRLRDDPRVTVMERVNVRNLDCEALPFRPTLVTCDVSFISLSKALPPALGCAAPGWRALVLVKPQFEAGREEVGKGGVVRDPAARQQAVQTVRGWVAGQVGWHIADVMPSPIAGGSGNEEFLLGAVRDD